MDQTSQYSIQPTMDDNIDVKDRIRSYLENLWSKHINPINVECSKWETEMVWYRSELINGATGDIFLVHRVDGICDVDGKIEIFEAFGKQLIFS